MNATTRPAVDSIASALAEHRPYLVQFARRRLHDSALVEDTVQDTLLAAWQGAASFEHRSAMRTWLTGILQHRIVDAVRAARRHGRGAPLAAAGDEAEPPAPDDEGSSSVGHEPVDWIDPSRRLEGRQMLDALTDLLDDLPETAAGLFELRLIEGLSNEQAAQALGQDPRRATVLLHRTLRRLRDGLAGHAVVRPQAVLAPEPAAMVF